MKKIYLFMLALFMSLSVCAEDSGICGPNLKWHLSNDGTLTISGEGKMYDYLTIRDVSREEFEDGRRFIVHYHNVPFSTAPWKDLNSNIYSLVIGDSVTSIGSGAFYNCRNLKNITITNKVRTIGEKILSDNLVSITIGVNVDSIGDQGYNYSKKAIWLCNTPPKGYKNIRASINYVPNELYRVYSAEVYPYLSSMFEVG